MRTIIDRRSLLVFPILLLAAASASAQDPNQWAIDMFDSTKHDFGVVARGAEVTHRFKVTNKYKQEIRIASVAASCGCTTPTFDKTPMKSFESTYIEISMDTNKFQHKKTSTVTVTFDPYAVVTIPVEVWIRSDVVLTPGSVNFGAVDHGTKTDRKLDIAYAYDSFTGDPNWAITGVTLNNKYLAANAVQKARGNGQVNYELNVTLLPNAQVGRLRQGIQLQTNDPVNPQLPVLVQAVVEADVTITPSVVQLGSVAPGTETVRTVVLRGRKPFAIEKVECESARQAFKMPPLTKDVKSLHVLSLTFTAPKKIGPFSEKLIVTIAGRPEPIVLSARGTIIEKSMTQQTSVPR